MPSNQLPQMQQHNRLKHTFPAIANRREGEWVEERLLQNESGKKRATKRESEYSAVIDS